MNLLNRQAFFCVALLLAFAISCTAAEDRAEQNKPEQIKQTADLIIHSAKIFTASPQHPWAQALVINDGHFIYVGEDRGAALFESAMTIDLQGRLLFPGMIDSHAHPGYVNVEKFGYVEGETQEAILASVKSFAADHPDEKWLRLCCWPTNMFVQNGQGPRKEVLDTVVSDRMVWFESETAHDYWLNSSALKQLKIDRYTPDPRPGLAAYVRDENGDPTGWVKEGAGVQHFARHFALVDEAHIQLHKESVAETLQILSRHGVTSLFDAGNKGFGDLTYSVIAELEENGRLPVRYYGTYQIFTPARAASAVSELERYSREYGGERLRFKSVKLFMDGITANQSAAYSKPYVGRQGPSATLLSVAELRDLLLDLHEAELDLHVHAIGDLAVKRVLDGVEAAQNRIGENFYPRITVAHIALVDPNDIPRFRELGVIANFTPWWFGASPSDSAKDLLGEGRFARMYQPKSVIDSGATYTFSSDEWWGGEMLATYINPFLGMYVGHTRQYPKEWWETDDDGVKSPMDERIPISDLLIGYTRNGAYQLRTESALGSIEVGKLADFVILNEDLFETEPEAFLNVRPSAVVMEGKLIQGEFPK